MIYFYKKIKKSSMALCLLIAIASAHQIRTMKQIKQNLKDEFLINVIKPSFIPPTNPSYCPKFVVYRAPRGDWTKAEIINIDLKLEKGVVEQIIFNPNNPNIFVCNLNLQNKKRLIFMEVELGNWKKIKKYNTIDLDTTKGSISHVSISPDGKYIAYNFKKKGQINEIHIIKSDSQWKKFQKIKEPILSIKNVLTFPDLKFNADGKYLAVNCFILSKTTLRYKLSIWKNTNWEKKPGKPILTIPNASAFFTFNHKIPNLCAIYDVKRNNFLIFNLNNPLKKQILRGFTPLSLEYSPIKSNILSIQQTRNNILFLDIPQDKNKKIKETNITFKTPSTFLAFSRTNPNIFATESEGRINIWNILNKEKPIKIFKLSLGVTPTIAFQPPPPLINILKTKQEIETLKKMKKLTEKKPWWDIGIKFK